MTNDDSSPFPPVRRVVTGHSSDGKAIVLRDEVQEPVFWSEESKAPTYNLYRTLETPAKLDDELKGEWVDHIKGTRDIVNANGSTLRSHDMAPGSVVPMHRTLSIDYGICTKGQITLVLDDGKNVVLNEGDVIVQRGTIHSWRNESTEWGRMLFVCLPAEQVVVNGKPLEDGFFE